MNKKLLFNITEDWFFCSHFLHRALTAKNSGYEIIVCSNENNKRIKIENYGFKFFHVPYNRKNLNPFYEIYVLFKLVILFRKLKPNIVHNIAVKPIILGSIASRISGIKSVINAPVGMGYLFTSNSLKAKFLKIILNFLFKKLLNSYHGNQRKNKVIFENYDDMNYFLNLGIVSRRETLVIRGAGVEIKKLIKRDQKHKIPTITLLARMLKDKGVIEFVEAAKIIKSKEVKANFLLVGDIDSLNPTSLKKETLLMWDDLNIVRWLGWIDNVDQILIDTDILCLPSYREGLPKALLEGAAMSLPIVTTDTVGCRDVVQEGLNGFLVPIKNVEELANKILILINNQKLRLKMGIESYKLAKSQFSADIINSQTMEVYNNMSED